MASQELWDAIDSFDYREYLKRKGVKEDQIPETLDDNQKAAIFKAANDDYYAQLVEQYKNDPFMKKSDAEDKAREKLLEGRSWIRPLYGLWEEEKTAEEVYKPDTVVAEVMRTNGITPDAMGGLTISPEVAGKPIDDIIERYADYVVGSPGAKYNVPELDGVSKSKFIEEFKYRNGLSNFETVETLINHYQKQRIAQMRAEREAQPDYDWQKDALIEGWIGGKRMAGRALGYFSDIIFDAAETITGQDDRLNTHKSILAQIRETGIRWAAEAANEQKRHGYIPRYDGTLQEYWAEGGPWAKALWEQALTNWPSVAQNVVPALIGGGVAPFFGRQAAMRLGIGAATVSALGPGGLLSAGDVLDDLADLGNYDPRERGAMLPYVAAAVGLDFGTDVLSVFGVTGGGRAVSSAILNKAFAGRAEREMAKQALLRMAAADGFDAATIAGAAARASAAIQARQILANGASFAGKATEKYLLPGMGAFLVELYTERAQEDLAMQLANYMSSPQSQGSWLGQSTVDLAKAWWDKGFNPRNLSPLGDESMFVQDSRGAVYPQRLQRHRLLSAGLLGGLMGGGTHIAITGIHDLAGFTPEKNLKEFADKVLVADKDGNQLEQAEKARRGMAERLFAVLQRENQGVIADSLVGIDVENSGGNVVASFNGYTGTGTDAASAYMDLSQQANVNRQLIDTKSIEQVPGVGWRAKLANGEEILVKGTNAESTLKELVRNHNNGNHPLVITRGFTAEHGLPGAHPWTVTRVDGLTVRANSLYDNYVFHDFAFNPANNLVVDSLIRRIPASEAEQRIGLGFTQTGAINFKGEIHAIRQAIANSNGRLVLLQHPDAKKNEYITNTQMRVADTRFGIIYDITLNKKATNSNATVSVTATTFGGNPVHLDNNVSTQTLRSAANRGALNTDILLRAPTAGLNITPIQGANQTDWHFNTEEIDSVARMARAVIRQQTPNRVDMSIPTIVDGSVIHVPFTMRIDENGKVFVDANGQSIQVDGINDRYMGVNEAQRAIQDAGSILQVRALQGGEYEVVSTDPNGEMRVRRTTNTGTTVEFTLDKQGRVVEDSFEVVSAAPRSVNRLQQMIDDGIARQRARTQTQQQTQQGLGQIRDPDLTTYTDAELTQLGLDPATIREELNTVLVDDLNRRIHIRARDWSELEQLLINMGFPRYRFLTRSYVDTADFALGKWILRDRDDVSFGEFTDDATGFGKMRLALGIEEIESLFDTQDIVPYLLEHLVKNNPGRTSLTFTDSEYQAVIAKYLDYYDQVFREEAQVEGVPLSTERQDAIENRLNQRIDDLLNGRTRFVTVDEVLRFYGGLIQQGWVVEDPVTNEFVDVNGNTTEDRTDPTNTFFIDQASIPANLTQGNYNIIEAYTLGGKLYGYTNLVRAGNEYNNINSVTSTQISRYEELVQEEINGYLEKPSQHVRRGDRRYIDRLNSFIREKIQEVYLINDLGDLVNYYRNLGLDMRKFVNYRVDQNGKIMYLGKDGQSYTQSDITNNPSVKDLIKWYEGEVPSFSTGTTILRLGRFGYTLSHTDGTFIHERAVSIISSTGNALHQGHILAATKDMMETFKHGDVVAKAFDTVATNDIINDQLIQEANTLPLVTAKDEATVKNEIVAELQTRLINSSRFEDFQDVYGSQLQVRYGFRNIVPGINFGKYYGTNGMKDVMGVDTFLTREQALVINDIWANNRANVEITVYHVFYNESGTAILDHSTEDQLADFVDRLRDPQLIEQINVEDEVRDRVEESRRLAGQANARIQELRRQRQQAAGLSATQSAPTPAPSIPTPITLEEHLLRLLGDTGLANVTSLVYRNSDEYHTIIEHLEKNYYASVTGGQKRDINNPEHDLDRELLQKAGSLYRKAKKNGIVEIYQTSLDLFNNNSNAADAVILEYARNRAGEILSISRREIEDTIDLHQNNIPLTPEQQNQIFWVNKIINDLTQSQKESIYAENKTQGFWDSSTGHIVLVAENINLGHAHRVFAHELRVHATAHMTSDLAQNWIHIAEFLKSQRGKDTEIGRAVDRIIRFRPIQFSDSRWGYWEEVAAYFVEDHEGRIPFAASIKAHFRHWFRRSGIIKGTDDITAADIMVFAKAAASYGINHHEQMKRGRFGKSSGDMFSRIGRAFAVPEDVARMEFDAVANHYASAERSVLMGSTYDRDTGMYQESNLNDAHWTLVRTPFYKKWFGDWEMNPSTASKIVDTNGEPLLVVHNTQHDYTVYDAPFVGNNGFFGHSGQYIYGSLNANIYDYRFTDRPRKALFLNVRNPLPLHNYEMMAPIMERLGYEQTAQRLDLYSLADSVRVNRPLRRVLESMAGFAEDTSVDTSLADYLILNDEVITPALAGTTFDEAHRFLNGLYEAATTPATSILVNEPIAGYASTAEYAESIDDEATLDHFNAAARVFDRHLEGFENQMLRLAYNPDGYFTELHLPHRDLSIVTQEPITDIIGAIDQRALIYEETDMLEFKSALVAAYDEILALDNVSTVQGNEVFMNLFNLALHKMRVDEVSFRLGDALTFRTDPAFPVPTTQSLLKSHNRRLAENLKSLMIREGFDGLAGTDDILLVHPDQAKDAHEFLNPFPSVNSRRTQGVTTTQVESTVMDLIDEALTEDAATLGVESVRLRSEYRAVYRANVADQPWMWSNLDEYSWIMVRTPSFKEQYGEWQRDPVPEMNLDSRGEPVRESQGFRAPDRIIAIHDTESVKGTNVGFYFSGLRSEALQRLAAHRGDVFLARTEALAMQMFRDGYTAEEIKYATGWQQEPSTGAWSYELSNYGGIVQPKSVIDKIYAEKKESEDIGTQPLMLTDVYDQEELYIAYPFLRNIHITTSEKGSPAWANYSRSEIGIRRDRFNNWDNEDIFSSLVHEIQHLIQAYHGWDAYTSSEYISELRAYDADLNAARSEIRIAYYGQLHKAYTMTQRLITIMKNRGVSPPIVFGTWDYIAERIRHQYDRMPRTTPDVIDARAFDLWLNVRNGHPQYAVITQLFPDGVTTSLDDVLFRNIEYDTTLDSDIMQELEFDEKVAEKFMVAYEKYNQIKNIPYDFYWRHAREFEARYAAANRKLTQEELRKVTIANYRDYNWESKDWIDRNNIHNLSPQDYLNLVSPYTNTGNKSFVNPGYFSSISSEALERMRGDRKTVDFEALKAQDKELEQLTLDRAAVESALIVARNERQVVQDQVSKMNQDIAQLEQAQAKKKLTKKQREKLGRLIREREAKRGEIDRLRQSEAAIIQQIQVAENRIDQLMNDPDYISNVKAVNEQRIDGINRRKEALIRERTGDRVELILRRGDIRRTIQSNPNLAQSVVDALNRERDSLFNQITVVRNQTVQEVMRMDDEVSNIILQDPMTQRQRELEYFVRMRENTEQRIDALGERIDEMTLEVNSRARGFGEKGLKQLQALQAQLASLQTQLAEAQANESQYEGEFTKLDQLLAQRMDTLNQIMQMDGEVAAEMMEQNGRDAATILKVTGFERDRSGKWWYRGTNVTGKFKNPIEILYNFIEEIYGLAGKKVPNKYKGAYRDFVATQDDLKKRIEKSLTLGKSVDTTIIKMYSAHLNYSEKIYGFFFNDPALPFTLKPTPYDNFLNSITDTTIRDEIRERKRLTLNDGFIHNRGYKLEDLYEDDDLYRAYPFLRNIRVTFHYTKNANGSFVPGSSHRDAYININPFMRNVFHITLLHEIQHAIQWYEGVLYDAGTSKYYHTLTELQAHMIGFIDILPQDVVRSITTPDFIRNFYSDWTNGEGTLTSINTGWATTGGTLTPYVGTLGPIPMALPQGQQKQADVQYPDFTKRQVDGYFSLSKKNREEAIREMQRPREGRPDLSEEQMGLILDELDKYDQPKMQKLMLKWMLNGSIAIPISGHEHPEAYQVEEAMELAAKVKVDPFQFNSPVDILNRYKELRPDSIPITPESVPELDMDSRIDHGDGIVSYQVQDDEAGQQAVRRIINSHWGKNWSNWCLTRANTQGELQQPEAWDMWSEVYNGLPKRVAFKNGKIISLMATPKVSEESTSESILKLLKVTLENNWKFAFRSMREYERLPLAQRAIKIDRGFDSFNRMLDDTKHLSRFMHNMFNPVTGIYMEYIKKYLSSESYEKLKNFVLDVESPLKIPVSDLIDEQEWNRILIRTRKEIENDRYMAIKTWLDWATENLFKISRIDDYTETIVDINGVQPNLFIHGQQIPTYFKRENKTDEFKAVSQELWWDQDNREHPNLDWTRDVTEGYRRRRSAIDLNTTLGYFSRMGSPTGQITNYNVDIYDRTPIPGAPGAYKLHNGQIFVDPDEVSPENMGRTTLYALIRENQDAMSNQTMAELVDIIKGWENSSDARERNIWANIANRVHLAGLSGDKPILAYAAREFLSQRIDARNPQGSNTVEGVFARMLNEIPAIIGQIARISTNSVNAMPAEIITVTNALSEIENDPIEVAVPDLNLSESTLEAMQQRIMAPQFMEGVMEDVKRLIDTYEDADFQFIDGQGWLRYGDMMWNIGGNLLGMRNIVDQIMMETVDYGNYDLTDTTDENSNTPRSAFRDFASRLPANSPLRNQAVQTDVEEFLKVLPAYIRDRIKVAYKKEPEWEAMFGENKNGIYKPYLADREIIFIRAYDRTLADVVGSIAHLVSRFGWTMWDNAEFTPLFDELYTVLKHNIKEELPTFFEKLQGHPPNSAEKAALVSAFISHTAGSIYELEYWVKHTSYVPSADEQKIIDLGKRMKDKIKNLELKISATFAQDFANNKELTEEYVEKLLRLTMAPISGQGLFFAYDVDHDNLRQYDGSIPPSMQKWENLSHVTVFGNDYGPLYQPIPMSEDALTNTYMAYKFRAASPFMQNVYRWWWRNRHPPMKRPGDTILGLENTVMLGRAFKAVTQDLGVALKNIYKNVTAFHDELIRRGIDTEEFTEAKGYEQELKDRGITDEKLLEKAQVTDTFLRYGRSRVLENVIEIRALVRYTAQRLEYWMRQENALAEDIRKMHAEMERFANRFVSDWDHRKYRAYMEEGQNDLHEMRTIVEGARVTSDTWYSDIAVRNRTELSTLERNKQSGQIDQKTYAKERQKLRRAIKLHERLDALFHWATQEAMDQLPPIGSPGYDQALKGVLKKSRQDMINKIDEITREVSTFKERGVIGKMGLISGARKRTLNENDPHDQLEMAFLDPIKDPALQLLYNLDQQGKIMDKLIFNLKFGENLLAGGIATLKGSQEVTPIRVDNLSWLENGTFLRYVQVDPFFMDEISNEVKLQDYIRQHVLGELITTIKQNFTILNWRMAVSNYIGNISNLILTGEIFRLNNLGKGARLARDKWWSLFLSKYDKSVDKLSESSFRTAINEASAEYNDLIKLYKQEMDKLNLWGSGVTSAEIGMYGQGGWEKHIDLFAAALQTASKMGNSEAFDEVTRRKWQRKVHSFMRTAREFYGFGDEWVKPLTYINNRAVAMAKHRALNDWSRYEGFEDTPEARELNERIVKAATREAALLTFKETTTWELAPDVVRKLARTRVRVLTPDFLLHSFQMVRIYATNLYRVKEIADELARLRTKGKENLNPYEEAYLKLLKGEFTRRLLGNGIYAWGAAQVAQYGGTFGTWLFGSLAAALTGGGGDDDEKRKKRQEEREKSPHGMTSEEHTGLSMLLTGISQVGNLYAPLMWVPGKVGHEFYAYNHQRMHAALTAFPVTPPTTNPTWLQRFDVLRQQLINFDSDPLSMQIANLARGKNSFGQKITGKEQLYESLNLLLPQTIQQAARIGRGTSELMTGTEELSWRDRRKHRELAMFDVSGIKVQRVSVDDNIENLGRMVRNFASNGDNPHRRVFFDKLERNLDMDEATVKSAVDEILAANERDMGRVRWQLEALRRIGVEKERLEKLLGTARNSSNTILGRQYVGQLLAGRNVLNSLLLTSLNEKIKKANELQEHTDFPPQERQRIIDNYRRAMRMIQGAEI